ncbi:MAG: glycosyltransferase family 2 protein [Chloroflexi bacterium]|nr:glycosyltransferase family 2 protein [Chloroflexota bacterium]
MPEPVPVSGDPLISVVMPVYNAGRYVGDAIRSILAQTYRRLELIVVESGSTDASADVGRDLAGRDDRIRPLFLPYCGVSRALNVAIALAHGEWIAHMEADDIALPQRLAIQMDWIRQTGAVVGGSLAKVFGEDDHLYWFPETHEAIRCELLFRCALLETTVLMRADIAREHPFDEDVVFQDYEMWTRLAPRYVLGNLQQILVKYRRHPQQTSIVRVVRLREDQRRVRRRYFDTLFPEATAEDYAAVSRVAEREPFSNLTDLERAGSWLVHLAQTPDAFLRRRMAKRWRAACQRSAHLGPECYRLYRRVAPQFGVAPARGSVNFWLDCALRLRPDSRTSAVLASIMRRMGPSLNR